MARKKNEDELWHDIGTCLRYTKSGKMVNKSKFKSKNDLEKTFSKLRVLGVVGKGEVYKCQLCKTFHYGTKEDMEK